MWFRKSTYSDYKLKPHKVRCVLWEACGNGPAKRNADPSLPAHTPLRDVLIGTVRKIIDTIKFSKFYLFLWGTYRWSSIMRLYFHSKQKRRQLRKKEKLVIFFHISVRMIPPPELVGFSCPPDVLQVRRRQVLTNLLRVYCPRTKNSFCVSKRLGRKSRDLE